MVCQFIRIYFPIKGRMSKKLTSIDIARLAGVSQTTVSRVLHDAASVTPKTKEKVLSLIRRYNYLPNAAARQMKTNRSHTIAVVVANLSNPLYPLMLRMLVRSLDLKGYRTIVWEQGEGSEELISQTVSESSVDGVIFATATDSLLDQLREISAQKPIILINRLVQSNAFDTIVSDNFAGGEAVAEYFIKGKRTNIGLLSAHSDASTIRDREKGFRSALLKKLPNMKLATSAATMQNFTYESGYEGMVELLESNPNINAVFCTNDIVAIGAIDAAKKMGREIPEDIWVIGYDDIPMAGWDCINLSTVSQPIQKMVDYAVERLLDRIDDPSLKAKSKVLPNQLITRNTTF